MFRFAAGCFGRSKSFIQVKLALNAFSKAFNVSKQGEFCRVINLSEPVCKRFLIDISMKVMKRD